MSTFMVVNTGKIKKNLFFRELKAIFETIKKAYMYSKQWTMIDKYRI